MDDSDGPSCARQNCAGRDCGQGRILSTRRRWIGTLAAGALAGRGFAAGRAQYVHLLNASTNQTPGVPFRLAVATLRLGLRERCRSRVRFRSSDPRAALPAPYEFSARDDLYESHLFDATLRTEGRHTISLIDETTGAEFDSNVVVVSAAQPPWRLYFGDIHIHSRWSFDGRGDPDYSYIYARDAMNLDFACLTEHDPDDRTWEKIRSKARELYMPGRFATLAAYEWTAHPLGEGHKNVYYRDSDAQVFRAGETGGAADLWTRLRGVGKPAMTVPHHPSARLFPVPWEQHDPEFQRAVEIYSTWGSSERPDGPRLIRHGGGAAPGHFVQDALRLGYRLGFVGGSDSHSGRPGYPAHSRQYYDTDYVEWEETAYPGGITGVYAEELTREAVFDAIRSRRCYATTGQRIILDFRADGHFMGSEYRSNDAPHLEVRVAGTAPLESVTIVKNGKDCHSAAAKGREARFEYSRTEPPRDTDYYYVRVVQRDGEMAWSSPIWVTRG